MTQEITLSERQTLEAQARSHELAAGAGKPQSVAPDVAEYMGAFEETGLSPEDAEASMFDTDSETPEASLQSRQSANFGESEQSEAEKRTRVGAMQSIMTVKDKGNAHV